MRTQLAYVAILCLLLSGSTRGYAQWTQVGDTIGGDYLNLAAAPGGPLCLSYQGPGRAYVIRRFNGAEWQHVKAPGINNPSSFHVLAMDRAGVPYIATDTSGSPQGRRLLVLKYDGHDWNAVGDASWPQFSAWGVSDLGFDAQNRPHVGFSLPGIVLRYSGSAWQRISVPYPGLSYGSLHAGPAGDVYFATHDSDVYQYAGDTTWRNIGRPGNVNSTEERLLTAATDGKLYLELLSIYGGDSTSMHVYDGRQWTQLGQRFAPKTLLGRVHIGADGSPFAVSREIRDSGETLSLLHFDGRRWNTVLIDSGITSSDPVSDDSGNLYVAVTNRSPGSGARLMKFDTRSIATSVPGPAADGPVSIRPVPASGEVLISNRNLGFNSRTATITDLQGRVMQRVRLAPECRVNTTSWPPGVYLLQLPDGNVRKLVKQ